MSILKWIIYKIDLSLKVALKISVKGQFMP